MAKAITPHEVEAMRLLDVAIKSLVATYQQTKLVGSAGYMDQAKAEKLMARAATRRVLRGNTGFRGDISAAGQVP